VDERAYVRIMRCGRKATALIEVSTPPLQQWLSRTWLALPPGAEGARLDWDPALAELLGDSLTIRPSSWLR
jgi:hypothetical protein